MATTKIAGFEVNLTDDGYLIDSKQWNKQIATEIALKEGIEIMTERHWGIIQYLQDFYKKNESLPSIRKLKKSGVVETKEFYKLFPDGPLKKCAKIAGLNKPESCV